MKAYFFEVYYPRKRQIGMNTPYILEGFLRATTVTGS